MADPPEKSSHDLSFLSKCNNFALAVLRRRVVPLLTVLFLVSTLTLYHDSHVLGAVVGKVRRDHGPDVFNTTLGFQKVFAIGFDERTDKHDAVTLASSFVGFTVDWSPAVSGEQVSKKAAPTNWDYEHQSAGALGCWRAHMNVLERIVSENIQSALILEDDTDWSVYLKNQLFELSNGARALQRSPRFTKSPYGHDWDFLWLGHCRAGPAGVTQDFWVVDNDTTVPPMPRRHAKWRGHVPDEVLRNDTRLLFRATAGMCMYSYAVTYEGARKMLSSMSLEPRNQPIDVSMSAMCRGRFTRPFKCYAVYPPLLASHRVAGGGLRDSDLNHRSRRYHDEHSWDIVHSAILNVPRLVTGEKKVTVQWPEDFEDREVDFDGEVRLPARGYLKAIDVAAMPPKNGHVHR